MTINKNQTQKEFRQAIEIPKTTASPELFPQSLREQWKSHHDLTIDELEEKLEKSLFSPFARTLPNNITLFLKYSDILSRMKVKRHLQNFLEDGDVANLLKAIPKGGYDHPLLREIISYLQSISFREKLDGMNELREKAEGCLKKIANAVAKYITSSPVKQPRKVELLLTRLDELPSNELKRPFEYSYMYIKRVYEKYKRECKKDRKVTASLIQKAAEELDPEKSKITQWEKEQESKAHKKAKRRTLNHLEKQTGIRIGFRELEDLLSFAKYISPKSNK